VKIYERRRPTMNGKHRTVFEVSDYTTGRRRLRGFTDHEKARKEAKRIANQLATGETTAAKMLNSEAASYGRALELLRPTGVSLEMASATFAKCFEILEGDAMVDAARFYAQHRVDRLTRKPVAEVVVELIESKKARGKSIRYTDDLSSRLTRFAKDFAVDVGTVTGPDIQRWLDGLNCAPTTAKNFRRVLYTLFGFAESRGYVFKNGNPVKDTEQISASGGAIEIFTPAEIAALLRAAPKAFLPFVALGAFAGLRTAEIARLDWRDVDLAGGFIHVASDKAKTAQRRLVPILPNLGQWLAPYAKQRGKVYKGNRHNLDGDRAALVEKAGVAWKDNGLRHSFVSYRLADIQNAAQVALEAGNSPQMVFRHYRELVKPDAAKAWFAIAPEQPANVLTLAAEKAAR
jgi:integrase